MEKDTEVNLCDSCIKEFATCTGNIIETGTGKGNDNVIECDGHEIGLLQVLNALNGVVNYLYKFNESNKTRETALAYTKMEEAQMWLVKEIKDN